MKKRLFPILAAIIVASTATISSSGPAKAVAIPAVGVLVVTVANTCALDDVFGRVAAWYYDVEFEGGAICG